MSKKQDNGTADPVTGETPAELVQERPKSVKVVSRVTVVNKRGVEARPLESDIDAWLSKGWSRKGESE